MSFFATSGDSFKAAEDLEFEDKEVVGFQCTDFNENATKKSLTLRVRVMTGKFKDKDFKIFMNQQDNDANMKRLSQFFHAFWTSEEIKVGTCNPAKLIGRKFTAKCEARKNPKPKEGQDPNKVFRNWGEFQDRGAGTAPPQQQSQAAAPVQQQPVAGSADGLSF